MEKKGMTKEILLTFSMMDQVKLGNFAAETNYYPLKIMTLRSLKNPNKTSSLWKVNLMQEPPPKKTSSLH